jgi:natural product precursor
MDTNKKLEKIKLNELEMSHFFGGAISDGGTTYTKEKTTTANVGGSACTDTKIEEYSDSGRLVEECTHYECDGDIGCL